MDKGVPSPQFEKLFKSLSQSERDSGASVKEILAGLRQEIEDCLLIGGVAPSIATSTKVQPVSAAGVASEWVLAEGVDPELRLMFIHGGSFISGTLTDHRHVNEALSQASEMAVLAVDYRLAPENPYPSGLDDCVTAWTWMQAYGPGGKGKPRATFLAGSSAGGGLAMATMLRLRDEGKPLPTAVAVFAPATDFTASSPSITERAHLDPVMRPEDYAWVANLYVADGTDLAHPYVSPAFGDFSGLPPFLVHAAERDLLHDDGKRVVERAKEASIDAKFKTLPGMTHGVQYWCHYVPEGLASLNEAGVYLKSHV